MDGEEVIWIWAQMSHLRGALDIVFEHLEISQQQIHLQMKFDLSVACWQL